MSYTVYRSLEDRVVLVTGGVRGVGAGISAVFADQGATVGVLPDVPRTLNWVRLASRFPVRILLEERDPQRPFRMGATAVVTIKGR